MKKNIFLLAIMAIIAVQSNAQVIYYGTPYWYTFSRPSEATQQAAIGGATALGLASIIGNTIIEAQEVKARKEAQERYDKEKVNQKAIFPVDMQKADSLYNAANYAMALQMYGHMAHNNDNYNEDLGDQTYLVSRIAECNQKLGTVADNPCPNNNFKARKTDYSAYDVDIENPVYTSKKKNNYAQVTRVSCNSKETRVEFEYHNTFNGEIGLGVKGNTYIKGKKSGKLTLRKVENITIAPAKTLIPYGRQTLKFTLVFPALDDRDDTFDFREPSSEWQFNKVVCK